MLITGDAKEKLQDFKAHTFDACITSPPYFMLRDYGIDSQIGTECTPDQYIEHLVDVFRDVRRTLRDDGTLWIVIGDSYAGSGKGGNTSGHISKQSTNRGSITVMGMKTPISGNIKPKDLIGIPWSLAFALRADGWYLRQDVIRQKPNAMPESVRDRCTRSHEYIFMLTKNRHYYYDCEAVKEAAVNGDPHPPRGSKGARTENLGRRKQDGHGRRYEGFNERYHSEGTRLWQLETGAAYGQSPRSPVEMRTMQYSRQTL